MARRTGALVRLACLASVAGAIVIASGHVAVAGAGQLADGRGYELVSAAEKNGGDVTGDQSRIRVADDGGAVTYSSLAGFGELVGAQIATEYMAVRSPAGGGQGWVTHGITPAQQALTYQAVLNGFEARYQQELSPELSKGVVFAWRPLTDNPFVANVANLYLREDLRSPGAGSYTLVSDCPVCFSPFGVDRLESLPQVMTSTPDFSHVLFESGLNLAGSASGSALKLYQWEKATQTVTLVGVLPDGRAASDSAAGTGHGPYSHPHAISTDGRKAFFMANQPAGVRNVYMRLDGTTTIKLNRSERTPPDTAQSARYADSSVTGSRVFLISKEKLTDDAAEDGNNLYMYDTTKPDEDPHNLTFLNVDNEPDPTSNVVGGVVGASADGSTVYFFDTSQLVAGLPQPPLPNRSAMYAWHEGTVHFVAFLTDQDEDDLADSSQKRARVSPSGDLAFLSTTPISPDGYPHGSCPNNVTGACAQVYVYRIATQQLRCASCNPSGAPASSDAQTLVSEGVGGSAAAAHLNRILTDDGQRAFFTSREALVEEDINNRRDAYEFDTLTGSINLLSSGRSTSDSYFMQTTPSGDDAFFVTRERLLGWDRDDNYDLYDARVGGGFPEPPPPPTSCTGADCRTTTNTPPAAGTPASAIVKSAGNLADRLRTRRPAKRRCRPGHKRKKHRGRTRCVKRRRHVRRSR